MWRKKVMLVDPSQTVLQMVGSALATAEVQPLLVGSFKEALKVNIPEHVDVVAIDITLPGIGDRSPIEALRGVVPDLKIIGTCGKNGDADANYLLRMARYNGADAVLEKPFEPGQLITIVDQIDTLSVRGRTSALVVDGNRTILQTIAKMLPKERYSIFPALSAEKALARPDIIGVDVVVIDASLQGMGAVDAIETLREKWPTLGIIAMYQDHRNDTDTKKVLDAVQEAGAHAAIKKPFRGKELSALVDKVALEQKRAFMAAYGDDFFAVAG